MDISVCIVNWNTKELLANCINSLQEKTAGVSYEVIIVDNNSADDSVDMIRQRYPQCKIVACTENIGFTRGNNRCLQEVTGKYVLFLNPDTILATNALYGMFQFMESNHDVGAVGCKLLNQDGSIQYVAARTFPTLWNQFCYLMMLDRLFPTLRMFSAIELSYWDHQDSREADCLTGACIFTRKQVMDRLKGFDDALFMYADDVDLCFRLKKEGLKIYYLASEAIYHLEGQSSKKRSEMFFSSLTQRESNHYYFLKHHGKISAFLYRLIIFHGSLFRLIITTVSIVDLRNNRLCKEDRQYISKKYLNLILWSLGLKKAQTS
ncbi:MAG: glycosyltransferase family 2 protein [Nitrospirae bacterium]|nr:glycosyltransferase family 2 protein [Nitrospirota bacterium]